MERVSVRNLSKRSPPCDEDLARADWYALIAVLFQGPPSGAILARIADAGRRPAAPADADELAAADSDLSRVFADLAAACAAATEDSLRAEFDAAFLGVGKPEVFLSASYYLTGFLHERPLADLRERLAGFGLARREDLGQTEDQIGPLCEVMRHLIVEGGSSEDNLATQRAFFGEFIAPVYEPLCDALEASGATDFYKHAGRLARAFFAVERQAFDFDS